MSTPRRIRSFILAALLGIMAIWLVMPAGSALAKSHKSGVSAGNLYYCDYGNTSYACLFYDAEGQGAYFSINYAGKCAFPTFKGYTFGGFVPPGNADGMGGPVLNNSASSANNSKTTLALYYGQNYTGNYDYWPPHTYGDASSYTKNNNGSGLLGC